MGPIIDRTHGASGGERPHGHADPPCDAQGGEGISAETGKLPDVVDKPELCREPAAATSSPQSVPTGSTAMRLQ